MTKLRAKLLIADLVQYVVKEMLEPPDDAAPMPKEKARTLFVALDDFLAAHNHYEALGTEITQLMQTACTVRLRRDALSQLKAAAVRCGDMPDVQQAVNVYLDARQVGPVTCFFCDREVNEDGPDSSTEYGIFFGCDEDWPHFGNPDSYI